MTATPPSRPPAATGSSDAWSLHLQGIAERHVSGCLIRAIGDGFQQNRILPYYNHNDYYARLLLRRVPRPCPAALDVGCGEGRLALELSHRSGSIVGIDPDPTSIDAAKQVLQASGASQLIQADFMDHDFGSTRFDFICAVASLHHMPFRDALEKMAMLLRPGGVVAVLGLYQSSTVLDLMTEIAAVPVNATLAWTRPTAPMAAPAIEPTMTLAEIRETAAEALPGATVRRLLLWRYLLGWRKRSYA